jgi:nucleoside phosphorylase
MAANAQSQYAALDMESAGVMNAIHLHAGDQRALVIRGISDLSDARKSQLDATSSGGLRRLAMRNAIRLFVALARTGELE